MNDLKGPRFRDALARRPDDLDDLLRRFFRSELPDPWPAPPQLSPASRAQGQQPPQPPRRRWFPRSSRLALAAAISFFLAGYLALVGAFPTSAPSRESIRPTTGHNDRIREVVPIPGGKAQIDGVQFKGRGRWSADFTVKRIPSAKLP